MSKENNNKEKNFGDKALEVAKTALKRTFFIPSLALDWLYGSVSDKPTDFNKALYSSIDPTGQRPDLSVNGAIESVVDIYKLLKKYYDRDFENIDYIKDTKNIPLQNRVAIAAWAKYNKLPYDESLIIDNGDGTYRLPKEIEKSMRKERGEIERVYKINKEKYDKLNKEYEERLEVASSNNDMDDYNRIMDEKDRDEELFYLDAAINMDKENLQAMDSLMLGKASVFNEFNYKNRDIRNLENVKGMLNVLGNHTLYKRDDGKIGYRDVFDLNQPFDFLLSGKPFPIKGVAGGTPDSSAQTERGETGGGEWYPSKDILNYIKNTEKFKTEVYNDGKRIPTIGYGFIDKDIINKYKKNGITREQADKEFERIVGVYSKELREATPHFDELNDAQKDALFSYYYNLGMSNYTTKSPKMQKALKEKNYKEVAKQMDFGYNDEANPGLRIRRDYERSIFNGEDKKPVVTEESGLDLSPEERLLRSVLSAKNELEYSDPLRTQRGEAFKHARELGKDVFMWNGKKYTTEIKKDGGSVKKNQDRIYNRLVNESGFSPIQAIAVIANLTHESGLTDDILGDNGVSYGLQQWQGQRRKNLFSYAKSKGHSKPTFEDQIDFLVYEYKNGQAFQFKNKGQNLFRSGKVDDDMFDYFQYSKADFDNAESLWDATISWNQGVGRPNKKYAMNDNRYDIAVGLAQRYGVDFGEERKYGDMGYIMDSVPAVKSDDDYRKQDYFNQFGQQLLSSIMQNIQPLAQPGMGNIGYTPAQTEEALAKDMEKEMAQVAEIERQREEEKRKALLAAFLPNIQLSIKGMSKN